MHWTVGKKLYAMVTMLSILVLGMLGGAYYVQSNLASSAKQVALKTSRNLERAVLMRYLVAEMRAANRQNIIRAGQRDGAGIEQTRRELEQYASAFATTATEIDQNSSTDEVKSLARDAAAAMVDYQAKVAAVTKLAAAFRVDDALSAQGASKRVGEKLEAVAGRLQQLQTKRLDVVTTEVESDARFGSVLLSTFAVIALIALAGVVFIVRDLVRTLTATVDNLRAGSEQVTSAATQVSASAQALSQGATEQAASLEETSASMEEMASMARKNAENSTQAAQLIADVDGIVERSNQALTDMTASMASIRDSSNKVSKIIKTIDDIAFQTNILALNAAVEAARAGDAGMGFAVVADEVRNLAQRSAQAARHDFTDRGVSDQYPNRRGQGRRGGPFDRGDHRERR